MGKTLTQKILEMHIVEGEYKTDHEIGISVDSILTNDSTGTIAYLQFESLGLTDYETEMSLCAIDHNNLESNYRNIDDQLYLQSFSNKHGVYFSRAGNGVSHQIYLERLSKPGFTLLGSDPHTAINGAVGMMSLGSNGIDLACAIGGLPYYLKTPRVMKINLTGKLSQWVSAKDLALFLSKKNPYISEGEIILEFSGEGLINLKIHERAILSAMAVELGAITAIFPSDNITKDFLIKQNREFDFVELSADDDAVYEEIIEINMDAIVPYAARPYSPLNIIEISSIEDFTVDQIIIGSCTNSSYEDIWLVSKILEGKTISRNVNLIICPGSKQVLSMISKDGTLTKLIDSGARILEPSCGPCAGIGYCIKSKGRSLRTFIRNYKGVCPTKDAEIYLVSPQTAAFAALEGKIIDPRKNDLKDVKIPEYEYVIDDRMIIPPAVNSKDIKINRGPSIKFLPVFQKHQDNLMGEIILKLPSEISSDDILPHDIESVTFYSDIYKVSEKLFNKFDADFHDKAKKFQNTVIVADELYGQRDFFEHIAIALRYLGVFAIIAKSFTLNEKRTLINSGILPLLFENKRDYEIIKPDTTVILKKAFSSLLKEKRIKMNYEKNDIVLKTDLTDRELNTVFVGGKFNYIKERFLNKDK